MSFLNHFKAALLFGVPRWVLARSLGYQAAAAIDMSAPVEVIGSHVGR
jgi:hypothetical protein